MNPDAGDTVCQFTCVGIMSEHGIGVCVKDILYTFSNIHVYMLHIKSYNAQRWWAMVGYGRTLTMPLAWYIYTFRMPA